MNTASDKETSATPGKPTSQGSRQQTYPGQGSQTGSEKLDRESAKGPPGRPPPRPPNAK